MKTLDIIYYSVIAINILATTYTICSSIKLRKKNKTIIDNIQKTTDDFIKEQSDRMSIFIKEHNEMVNIANERNNLLSRENVKLIDQNEELKERLRSLGIKDFDVM